MRDLRKWESDGVLTGDLSSWQRSAFTADEVTFSSSNLSITDANMLHDQTPFFSKDFFIQGLSATSGYKPIGTCTIPESISKVHIKTTGLCAYFYNEDFWISLGEINGTLSV